MALSDLRALAAERCFPCFPLESVRGNTGGGAQAEEIRHFPATVSPVSPVSPKNDNAGGKEGAGAAPPADPAALLAHLRGPLSCQVTLTGDTVTISPPHRCPPAVLAAALAVERDLRALLEAEASDFLGAVLGAGDDTTDAVALDLPTGRVPPAEGAGTQVKPPADAAPADLVERLAVAMAVDRPWQRSTGPEAIAYWTTAARRRLAPWTGWRGGCWCRRRKPRPGGCQLWPFMRGEPDDDWLRLHCVAMRALQRLPTIWGQLRGRARALGFDQRNSATFSPKYGGRSVRNILFLAGSLVKPVASDWRVSVSVGRAWHNPRFRIPCIAAHYRTVVSSALQPQCEAMRWRPFRLPLSGHRPNIMRWCMPSPEP